MKVLSSALLGILLCNPMSLFAGGAGVENKLPAEQTQVTNNVGNMFNHFGLGALYSYTDFKFNSASSGNFNRYFGHSNLYALSGDNVVLMPGLIAGLSILKVDTKVNSKMLVQPSAFTSVRQSIRNYTLFGHVLKNINKQWAVDLSGAYGTNNINTSSILAPGTPLTQYGAAKNASSNWFLGLTAAYSKPWKKFLFSANAKVLYSQINSGAYVFNFAPQNSSLLIAPLTNKVTYIMENAELGYHVTPSFMPFVNAGLVQVAQFKNSRPLIVTPINGTLPQLNMNKPGYRVGGGLSFNRKSWSIRLEEQYYNSNNTFKSYQTLLGLKYYMF